MSSAGAVGAHNRVAAAARLTSPPPCRRCTCRTSRARRGLGCLPAGPSGSVPGFLGAGSGGRRLPAPGRACSPRLARRCESGGVPLHSEGACRGGARRSETAGPPGRPAARRSGRAAAGGPVEKEMTRPVRPTRGRRGRRRRTVSGSAENPLRRVVWVETAQGWTDVAC